MIPETKQLADPACRWRHFRRLLSKRTRSFWWWVKISLLVAWLAMCLVIGRYVSLRFNGRLMPHDEATLQYFSRESRDFSLANKRSRGIWVWMWKWEQEVAEAVSKMGFRAAPNSGGLFGHRVSKSMITWKGSFQGSEPEIDPYLPDVPVNTPWKGYYRCIWEDRSIYVKAWADIRAADWVRLRDSTIKIWADSYTYSADYPDGRTVRQVGGAKLTRFPDGREKLLTYSRNPISGGGFQETLTYDGRRLVMVFHRSD
jgi:hypothetical protein